MPLDNDNIKVYQFAFDGCLKGCLVITVIFILIFGFIAIIVFAYMEKYTATWILSAFEGVFGLISVYVYKHYFPDSGQMVKNE